MRKPRLEKQERSVLKDFISLGEFAKMDANYFKSTGTQLNLEELIQHSETGALILLPQVKKILVSYDIPFKLQIKLEKIIPVIEKKMLDNLDKNSVSS